ncbi:MAG: histidine kinase [Nitrospinaceae bacterium]|nr:MAG: histidine kinase [Nitrospinaceae bacterium]
MTNRAQEIRSFVLENIPSHPKNIVAVTAESFNVTRMTVHRHLNRLLRDKKIVKTGTTKGAEYCLKTSLDKTLIFQIEPETHADQVWTDYLEDDFSRLSNPVKEICRFAFVQIFDNALFHSGGKGVVVKTVWKKDSLELNIIDDGAGLFQGIKKALGFNDIREGVLQLSKGKFTTASSGHQGQGIFWVSRLCDVFGIFSNGLFYCKDNLRDDWFLENRKISKSKGTKVSMAIGFHSARTLSQVIQQYGGDELEAPLIHTTEILIQLSQMKDEPYISRAQAKRALHGAERFQRVVLDFKNIPTVGQAFVDEVFHVFRSEHPKTDLKSIHANPDVQFMIEKSLPVFEKTT